MAYAADEPAAQQITRNILNRMLARPGHPVTARSGIPSPIVLIAMAIAAVFVWRAWISSRIAP